MRKNEATPRLTRKGAPNGSFTPQTPSSASLSRVQIYRSPPSINFTCHRNTPKPAISLEALRNCPAGGVRGSHRPCDCRHPEAAELVIPGPSSDIL